MSPSLVIRYAPRYAPDRSAHTSPIIPCERCALHARECVYDPTELRRNWAHADTMTLPACTGCPDDDGCWHVLGGRMVRPKAVVFEEPRVVEVAESWRE